MKRIPIAVAVLFAALWTYPLVRAISFFLEAQEYYRDTGSINASQDLHYSRTLLTCYVGCLVSTFLFAALLHPRPHAAFILPGIILVIPVLEVLLLRPEAPIVLFTMFDPWHLLLLCMAALLLASVFAYSPRKKERIEQRTQHTVSDSKPET